MKSFMPARFILGNFTLVLKNHYLLTLGCWFSDFNCRSTVDRNRNNHCGRNVESKHGRSGRLCTKVLVQMNSRTPYDKDLCL